MSDKLDMIYDMVKEARDEQRKTNRCLTEIKIKQENHEGRIKKNESDMKNIGKMALEHIKNKEKHYNPYYNESFPAKIWRKKAELGSAGVLIFVLERAIDYYNNGGT